MHTGRRIERKGTHSILSVEYVRDNDVSMALKTKGSWPEVCHEATLMHWGCPVMLQPRPTMKLAAK